MPRHTSMSSKERQTGPRIGRVGCLSVQTTLDVVGRTTASGPDPGICVAEVGQDATQHCDRCAITTCMYLDAGKVFFFCSSTSNVLLPRATRGKREPEVRRTIILPYIWNHH
jgi:hypothetical protein